MILSPLLPLVPASLSRPYSSFPPSLLSLPHFHVPIPLPPLALVPASLSRFMAVTVTVYMLSIVIYACLAATSTSPC